jgi:hypothetical protein
MGKTLLYILIIVVLVLALVWFCRGAGPANPPDEPITEEPVSEAPDTISSTSAQTHDLAVVKLDIASLDQLDSAANLTVPVSRHFLEALAPSTLGTNTDWNIDDMAEIVGFGISGGSEVDDPLKRRATIQITDCAASAGAGKICFQFANTSGPAICGGDSGGPMFANTGANSVLIGVASSSAAFCSAGEARFVDVTLPELRAWLESKMTGTAVSSYSLIARSVQGELTGPGDTDAITIDLSMFNSPVEHLKLTLNYPDRTPASLGAMITNKFSSELASGATATALCQHDLYAELGTCQVNSPAAQTWAAGVKAEQGMGYYQLTLTGLLPSSGGP